MAEDGFLGRFPALTHAQRYHFDVYGYVIVPNTLAQQECETLIGVLRRLRAAIEDGQHFDEVNAHRHDGFIGFERFHAVDPALTAYLAKPHLVGIAEELCGGPVRLNSCYAIFNRRAASGELPPTASFHKSVEPAWGTWTANGLFHTCMLRTMTNLTDVGPDDGGTIFVAGSHKLDVPLEQVVGCAEADPSLVHQVTAPAGATVVFSESTVHATGPIRSDRERIVISGAYTPTMFQAWDGIEPATDAVETVPRTLRSFLTGSMAWRWTNRYRTLEEPATTSQPDADLAGARPASVS